MSLKCEPTDSDHESPEDYAKYSNVEIDPYNDAMQNYHGKIIAAHEQLKEVMIRLNPRDYLDWDGFDFHKSFDDPARSGSSS